jgi:hypothetical protein
VRLLALPLPGTVDTKAWKAWTTAARASGLASVYGPRDSEILAQARATGRGSLRGLLALHPFPRAASFYRGELEVVDYPPLSMELLHAVGSAYARVSPGMESGPLFNAFINTPPLIASLGLALLLYRSAKGALGEIRALAFWANPAALLGSVLGYQDTVFGLAAIGAAILIARKRMVLGSALVVVAGLLKPQGSLLLPTLLALLLGECGLLTVLLAGMAALATAAVVFLPFVGHVLSALDGCRRPLEEATVSAQSLNLGWIAGYALDWTHVHAFPLARILTLDEFRAMAGFDARTPSRALLLLLTLANVGILLGSRSEARVPLSLVLQAHLYALCGTSVHENHTFLALFAAPLLLGCLPEGRRILALTSAFLFLNLFLLEGIGRNLIPDRRLHHLRLLTGVDLSVLVAVGHVALVAALFYWAAKTLIPSR